MANANIFAQYVKPVRSMQDYANDYDVAEQNQLALAAKRMDMQKAQRGEADAQTMRGIAQQYGGDENALIRAYRQGGFLDQAAGLEKSIADRLKAKADAGKTDADTRKSDAETQAKGFDLAKNRYNQYRMALGALAGDPALAKGKVLGVAGGLVDAGILTPELAQKLTANLPDDPEALRADIIAGRDAQLSPEQQSKLFAPEFSWQDSGQQKIPVQVNPRAPGYTPPTPIQKVATPGEVLTDTRTREEGAKNRGVQIRGQNLTDSRAREGTWSLNSDGVLVNSRSGETKAATGAGGRPVGSPKLNELQGKATGFASRMKDAEKTLGELEDKVMPSQVAVAGYKSEFPNWLPGGQILGAGITAANRTLNPYVTEEAMKYQQAQENWVTANLRLESGAVIGPEEMQKEIQKYFPQPGDPKSLRDQKKAARAVAQRAVTAQAGPGQNMIKGIVGRDPREGEWKEEGDDPLGLRR